MHPTTVEVVDLTADLAKRLQPLIPEWQRHERVRWTKRLREAMEQGLWRISNDALVLRTDEAGNPVALENGQHRVMARLEANVEGEIPVLLVTRPVDPDQARDFAVYDAGVKRTFGDWLTTQGLHNTGKTASIVRAMWVVDQAGGFWARTADPSTAALVEFWETVDVEALKRCVQLADTIQREWHLPISVIGAALMLIWRDLGQEVAEGFAMAILETPDIPHEKASGPVLLRRWITNVRGKGDRSRNVLGQVVIWNYVAKAFSFYMAGLERQVLAWKTNEGPQTLIQPWMHALVPEPELANA